MAERLLELGGVLAGLAVLARFAGRFSIPTIPLYLIAGLAFGRGGILPLVTTAEFIQLGSEIGLILLLFMLGLENSASDLLRAMRRSAPAGFLDVAANIMPGFVGGLLLGWGIVPALFLGGVTLVSSSGIAAKLLTDFGWSEHPEGKFVVSVAVFEDLAMAIYLPVLAVLTAEGAGVRGIGLAIVAIVGVVVVLIVAIRFEIGVSRLIFARSDEATLLSILGLAIFVAGIAELVQVSAAVGALLAGIVLSGPAAHNARALLMPLRDLFAALFFAFIGLSIDPRDLPEALAAAVVLALASIGTKFITAYVGGSWAALGPAAKRRSASLLIPRGEFSLAIAGLAVAAGLEPRLPAVAVAYVLILITVGSVLARIEQQRSSA